MHVTYYKSKIAVFDFIIKYHQTGLIYLMNFEKVAKKM